MCCCNYPKRFRAESVTVAGGITTLTIPATAEINPGDLVEILVAVPIPDGTNGTQLSVTNGTLTGSVFVSNGNYFRPRPLLSRTVFLVQFFSDPEHFQLVKIKR